MRINKIRAELKKLREELDFIEGMLHNERLLETCDCADLTLNEIDRLDDANAKLITQIIQLETLLEVE